MFEETIEFVGVVFVVLFGARKEDEKAPSNGNVLSALLSICHYLFQSSYNCV